MGKGLQTLTDPRCGGRFSRIGCGRREGGVNVGDGAPAYVDPTSSVNACGAPLVKRPVNLSINHGDAGMHNTPSDLEEAYNKGQSDGSRGEYDPPVRINVLDEMVWPEETLKVWRELNEACDSGHNNARSNSWPR